LQLNFEEQPSFCAAAFFLGESVLALPKPVASVDVKTNLPKVDLQMALL
jgi:hypothetical protein